MRVALLAGGTGGAKLAAGMQEELGAELSVIANTGDDIEVARRPRLPRPRPRHLLAQRRNRRGARLGNPRRHLHRLRAAAAARRAGLVRPLRPRPRRLPLPAPVPRRGRPPDRRPGADRPRPRRRGAGAADVRRAGPHPGAHRGRLARAAGVPDRRPRRARGRGVELEGIAEAEPTPEVLEALRAAEAIVIGPSNPVISIGPILAVPGMREAIAASAAPVVAVSPYVAGEVVKGPTDRFMAGARPPDHRGRRRLALRRPDRRDGRRRGRPRPAAGRDRDPRRADADGGRRGRARVARIVLDYAASLA